MEIFFCFLIAASIGIPAGIFAVYYNSIGKVINLFFNLKKIKFIEKGTFNYKDYKVFMLHSSLMVIFRKNVNNTI